jgi:hypothetical protein
MVKELLGQINEMSQNEKNNNSSNYLAFGPWICPLALGPLALAFGPGLWPWPLALAFGPWPLTLGILAFDPWPLALGLWPWPLAHGPWPLTLEILALGLCPFDEDKGVFEF